MKTTSSLLLLCAIIILMPGCNRDRAKAVDLARRGDQKLESGDFLGAAGDFQQAAILNPKEASYRYKCGKARQGLTNPEAAVGAASDFDDACRLDPNNAQFHLDCGSAYMDIGESYKASNHLHQALEIDSKFALAYYKRGILKEGNHDLDGAVADYTRALEIDPNDPKLIGAYTNRAVARLNKEDIDGAIADCDHALLLNPKSILDFSNRGICKRTKGDLAGAVADFTRAVEIDPKAPDPYYHRALTEFLQRNWTEALADFRQRCGLDDGQNTRLMDAAHFYIWIIRARLGERESANGELASYMKGSSNGKHSERDLKTADYLCGKINEQDLEKAGEEKYWSGYLRYDSNCDFWFFVGIRKLLDGDKNAAGAYFQKCLSTAHAGMPTFGFAKAELQALGN